MAVCICGLVVLLAKENPGMVTSVIKTIECEQKKNPIVQVESCYWYMYILERNWLLFVRTDTNLLLDQLIKHKIDLLINQLVGRSPTSRTLKRMSNHNACTLGDSLLTGLLTQTDGGNNQISSNWNYIWFCSCALYWQLKKKEKLQQC